MPTLEALSRERSPYTIHLDDYKTDLMVGLSSAWNNVIARECIEQRQECQKVAYDQAAKDPKLEVGQRVMVDMPSEVHGYELLSEVAVQKKDCNCSSRPGSSQSWMHIREGTTTVRPEVQWKYFPAPKFVLLCCLWWSYHVILKQNSQ